MRPNFMQVSFDAILMLYLRQTWEQRQNVFTCKQRGARGKRQNIAGLSFERRGEMQRQLGISETRRM